MKFTKRQKEILGQIAAGTIYDIRSFVDYFRLSHVVRFDARQLENRFSTDDFPKNYYFPKQLRAGKANMLSEEAYSRKLQNKELNPENYVLKKLRLKHDAGLKTKVLDNETYEFNFYEGVSILNAPEDIFEFLILWQYLKSEMLVLELPQKCPSRTLGFFFVRKERAPAREDLDEKIDYDDFTCSDLAYLEGNDYVISEEYCTIYGDYLNKKISPSPELRLFIQRGFCTKEEKIQRSALWAAWIAIIVSVLLAVVPVIQNIGKPSEYGDILTAIAGDIADIETAINSSHMNETFVTKFDELTAKLDIITDMHTVAQSSDTDNAPPTAQTGPAGTK